MRRELVAVAAFAVALVACGGVEQEPNLAKAVERTEAAGSSRIEVRALINEGTEQTAVQCDGSADYARKRLRFSCNRGFGEAIVVGDTMYLTSDTFGVDIGKPWVKLPLEDDDTISDFSPEKLLGMLREASLETERVGEQDVRGEPTVRFRLTVNCEQAEISCSGTAARVDVWIDDAGLVRRIQFEDDGQPATIEFFDFGTDGDIEAPPADQVAKEPVFGSASGSGSGSGGISTSPAVPCIAGDAKPISRNQAVAALRRHGFTMSAEACGHLTNVTRDNSSDVLAREGHVYCSVSPEPPAGAPKKVVRRGVDGGDAELLLANLECMILADSPDSEAKIDPLEAAFEDLQRAIQP